MHFHIFMYMQDAMRVPMEEFQYLCIYIYVRIM